MGDTPESEDLLGFLAGDSRYRRDPDDHPSVETLTAYQANELTPEEDNRIQEHLLICRHCTEMLLDLEAFLRPAQEEGPAPADFEQAADWRRLREQMTPGQRTVERKEPRGGKEQDPGQLLRSLRIFQTLAAALFVLVIGLGVNTLRAPRGPEVWTQTTLNFMKVRSVGEANSTEVHLPCALRLFTSEYYPRYRVEIVGRRSRISKEITSLDNNLLLLNRGYLEPGVYQVSILGLNAGRPKSIGNSLELIVKP